MVEPAFGPFLFDTSAESRLAHSETPALRAWFAKYVSLHPMHLSVITVMERLRGYGILLSRAKGERSAHLETARQAYLSALGRVWPVDEAVALIAAELTIMLPHPPSPPKRSHHHAESRQDRLVRWRFDILIAATALVADLPLVHDNPIDFEAIRAATETSPDRFLAVGPLQLIRTTRLT